MWVPNSLLAMVSSVLLRVVALMSLASAFLPMAPKRWAMVHRLSDGRQALGRDPDEKMTAQVDALIRQAQEEARLGVELGGEEAGEANKRLVASMFDEGAGFDPR